jgi:hypothetical protein
MILQELLFNKNRKRYETVEVFESPLYPKSKIIYVISEGAQQLHATLSCPCGCLRIIHLNLLNDPDPFWRIRIGKNGYATISPSIWLTEGCKSHFFIRRGKVAWVKNTAWRIKIN